MDTQLAEQYKNEIGTPFTDSLTGLYNNGFFQITLEYELKRYDRYGNGFSIALIDVDSFSHFNMIFLKDDIIRAQTGRNRIQHAPHEK